MHTHLGSSLGFALLIICAQRASAQRGPTADSGATVPAAVSHSRGPAQARHWHWHWPATVAGWVATAQHSPFATRRGTTAYRDFYLVGFRAAWPIHGRSKADPVLRYFVDLIPIAITTDNPDYSPSDGCRPGWLCREARPIPHTVYAAGLSPIGLSLRVLRLGHVRLALEGSAGALWFTRPVPDPDATKFNFTAAGGAMLEVDVARGSALRLRYLYHHTSNGGRGIVNPGLNSRMIAVGLEWEGWN